MGSNKEKMGGLREIFKPLFDGLRGYEDEKVRIVEQALEAREKEILGFASQLKDLSEILQGELPELKTRDQIYLLFGASLEMIAGKLQYARESKVMDKDKVKFYSKAFEHITGEDPDISFINRLRLLVLQLRSEKILW